MNMTDDPDRAWWQSWLSDAPNRWLGRRSLLQQTVAGSKHALDYVRHLARGNRVAREEPVDSVATERPPVLLIHGFLGTRGSMMPLERRLEEDGFAVFSFNLGTLNSRDIRRSAFLIHRKVELILSQTRWETIDIVGHSMGGLIGLYYGKKLGGDKRIRRLVMMGTPFRGTWAAALGVVALGWWSTSSWQLLPRSKFLDELSQGPIPEGMEVYTIAAARDWVCPPASSNLQGAKRILVPLGHASLVISEIVYEHIREVLLKD